MARNGFPDNPGDYPQDDYPSSDPTQYANYGGTGGSAYSEYGPPTGYPGGAGPAERNPDPVSSPTPWFQRPAALIGLGVLTAAVLALLVFAVVRFTNAGTSQSPAVTSSSITATTSSAPSSESAAPSTATETAAPAPSSTAAPPPPPTTVTTTVTPTTTTAEPTTTQTPTPSTTTSISTSVTTITETTTKPVLPTIPWPTLPSPTLFEPGPEG